MPKNQVLPTQITTGSRYIFFKTLSYEENPSLRALGKHAFNKLASIDKALMGIDKDKDKDIEGFSRIEKYLHFLENTAKQMQQNEAIFIQQTLQKIKKINNKFNNEDLKDISKILDDITNGYKIDYDKLMVLLNKLLLDPKEKKNIIKYQYQNIKNLEENFNKLSDDEQKEATQVYLESYEKYRKEFASKMKQNTNQNKVEVPYITELIADKINAVISSLSNNPILLDEISKQLMNNGVTSASLLEVIVGIITETVFKDTDKSVSELIAEISDNITNNIDTNVQQFIETNSFSAFSQRTQKTLEQLAMRKENEFEGLANAALMIDNEEMNAVFMEYDPDNKYKLKDSYQYLNELIKQNKDKNLISNRKGSFTRALGLAIQNKIIEKVNKQIGITEFPKIRDEIKKNANKYYQKRKLKAELATQLKITQINHADIAEIAASKELHNAIIDIWLDRVNGKTMNLKADVSFIVGFSPKQGKTKLPINDLNNIINGELKNFLPDYREIAGGATNTEASYNVLADKMRKVIKQIEEKLKITDHNRTEVENLLNELYDAIYGSISVKDYELYNNNLGFHGGSLGGGGTPESVINNIINMYKTAGIDAIDANDVLFAVLNSTDSTYGNDAMRTHVANYLLGGAALVMFDEDFNIAQKFLEQTESTLFSDRHIRSVQLYKLNSIYVPASYILYTIYEELVPIYQDIVLNFNNFPKTNQVIINTHNLGYKDIPIGPGYELAINRWNYISEHGIKNTKIQFMFMAGMLDIFKNLGEAFKIKLS